MRLALLSAAFVAAAAAPFLVPPAAGHHDTSPPVVTYSLSGSAGRNGWYVSDVTVNWSVSEPQGSLTSTIGCEPALLINAETAGTTRACTAASHGGSTSVSTLTIRIDKTAPQVAAAGTERDPDANGWYTHPVAVAFSGTDALSGIESCTSVRYEGPDTGGTSITGTCADRAGNSSGGGSFALRYDATPPQLSVPTPARAPDWRGWYNRPVAVGFAATDATSGLEACDAPTYGGPDAAEVKVTGACRDKAGNAASGSLTLRYDATPPRLTKVRVGTDAARATLQWWASADSAIFAVTRTPGFRGRASGLVYRGPARRFRDRRVAVGKRYVYRVVARDQAGNTAVKAAGFRLRSGIIRPGRGATVRQPPLLLWRPLAGASYYNLQLFRGDRKIHSVWPRRTRFRLPRRWSFADKRYRLVPGEYRWYIWPGYGSRLARKYGPLYGESAFVFAARPQARAR